MENKQSDHAEPEVLSGWKDIARYLGKGVRTVQRYERELHLPVRRVSGTRGSVTTTKSDLDNWLKSSPTVQESFIRSIRIAQENLRSQLAQGTAERERLQAQMIALRNEVRASVREVRESTSKIRQQLNETRKRQDSMASVIRRYSKVSHLVSVDVKHRKPN